MAAKIKHYFTEVLLGFSCLLTPAAANAKTAKQGKGYVAAIMHLAPHILATRHSVCPWSTPGCRRGCLNTSGRGQVSGALSTKRLLKNNVHRARIMRTRFYWKHRRLFILKLIEEIARLQRRADKLGLLCVVRLNGTSDIAWETVAPELFTMFPRTQFYDYTKSFLRAQSYAKDASWPENYHLTYSWSENDNGEATTLLGMGVSVAMVFRQASLPTFYFGVRVIDGNVSDWRFTDPPGVWVGLTAKARAKDDSSGFVVDVDPFGPSRNGSRACRNAAKSIAAGGTVEYCTCSGCF